MFGHSESCWRCTYSNSRIDDGEGTFSRRDALPRLTFAQFNGGLPLTLSTKLYSSNGI